MPRMYTVPWDQVAGAAMALSTITGAAGKTIRIKRFTMGATNTALATAQSIALKATNLTSYTVGSGGSSVTPKPTDPGDSAASFTARISDTTLPTGTAGSSSSFGAHIYAGIDFTYPPGQEPCLGGTSDAWYLGLENAPTGTVSFSGTILVEESGG